MRFTITEKALEVWNDGEFERCRDVATLECSWLETRRHRCDFHSFRKMASGDKRNRPGSTGAFGVGFTAVYQLTDRPELLSNGEFWIIDELLPEEQRIQRAVPEMGQVGTTFRLPWATQPSRFRSEVRQEVVSAATIASFIFELFEAIPRAMPFLKKLCTIDAADGMRSRTFERRTTTDGLVVTASDGDEYKWFVLRGDFNAVAVDLKAKHPSLIEDARSSAVAVAFPIDHQDPAGLLYATLPTEEAAHLPVLINADFYPGSDRKRIRFDEAPESEWNRAAIRAAAATLASNLERIPAVIGDQAFVHLLTAARELSGRLASERIEPCFAAFWAEVTGRLPTAEVVPTETRGYGSPQRVRLWSDEREFAAVPLLHILGIDLVDRRVKDEWYPFRDRELGLQNLNLGDIVGALRAKHLTSRCVQQALPDELAAEDTLQELWAVLEVLLQIRDRSNQESRDALLGCAVVPGWDGALWPIRDVYRIDQTSQDLLADLEVAATFLDHERIEQHAPRIIELTQIPTSSVVLKWIEEVFETAEPTGEFDRGRVLAWFYERRAALDDIELARVARLPVFPTASGPKPLIGMALPGDFIDQLGLARVVVVDGIEEMRPFLHQLGAERLTFAAYCSDYVTEAIVDGKMADEQRRKLLGLLAARLSEVQDDSAVRNALRPLELVPCLDGVWRAGDDVYLRPGIREIVSQAVHLAEIPSDKPSAHERLYIWLGVAEEPRPADVEARCRQLMFGPDRHRATAEAIIGYVGRRFVTDTARAQVDYARLRDISWLPIEGDRSKGYRPSVVFTGFRKTLFATQAQFLDVSLGVQREAADFLDWLGVRSNPEPRQVVEHLLSCASRGEPVREDMWIYLNQNASDPALGALHNRDCLLILETNKYVRPGEVYWGSHPFGRWRYLLGPRFSEYRTLLERLGVAHQPRPGDAIEVLQDVAAQHGGEHAPLLDADVLVVQACWRLLSESLTEEALTGDELQPLGSAEVVLDSRSWLRKPGEVFFRDSLSLAERFDDRVRERLIERPEGLWSALAEAGVRNLSDAVLTHIVEQRSATGDGVLSDRLRSRRRLILRVLNVDDHDASQKLDRFDAEVHLLRLSTLAIVQTIEVGGELHTSVPFERCALYLADDRTLMYVDDGQVAPVWVEIARELVRALGVEGTRAAGAAAAIKGVLGAQSDDAARRELDELGYAALDASDSREAEPTVATGLGGTPVPGLGDDESNDTSVEQQDEPGASTAPATDDSLGDQRATGSSSPRSGERAEAQATSENESDSGGTRRDPTHEYGSRERSEGTRTSTGASVPASGPQSRLRSYVEPAAGLQNSTDRGSGIEDKVERAGVDAALAYEREHGRDPEEMPPMHPGFDIRSVGTDGSVRIIEVKATADPWGARGVALSSTQFVTAQQRREEFWLYVVDQALTAPRVHSIRDPATKVEQYFFDDGWRVVSERSIETVSAALPDLHLPASPDGVPGAVPFRDAEEAPDGEVEAWIACTHPSRRDGWFAIRIHGEGLGLAFRGGIAFVEPIDREPAEDELVLVILHDQIDPDSKRYASIRHWRPELDAQGNRLALRLWSSTSVEPLTVTRPELLWLRGVVRATLRPSELEDLLNA
jgi:hypothetical protein